MNKETKIKVIGKFPLIGTPGTLPQVSDFLKRRRKIGGLKSVIRSKKGGLIKKS
jgi:hypothetical protein